MTFTLKWRYLLKLAAVFAIAGASVFFIHRVQARKQVGVFLHLADRARDAMPPDHVHHITYLHRYLMSRPDDTDVRERLGRVMTETAKGGKQFLEGYLVLEEALRREPDRDDLRRYVADTAMSPRVGLFAEAQAHLDILMRKKPNDGELEGLYARCLAARGKFAAPAKEKDDPTPAARSEFGAVEWYGESIVHRPDLVNSYTGRATLLRRELKRASEADEVVAQLLVKNPNNFRTHLAVADYWRAFGAAKHQAVVDAPALAKAQAVAGESVEAATVKAISRALKLAPDELDVILLAADVARNRAPALFRDRKRDEGQKLLDEAKSLLSRGLELHAKSPRVYLAMASLEAATRQPSDGVAVIRKGLDAIPDSPELVVALLDYQVRAGDAAGASETLDKLQGAGLPPAHVEYQQARILAVKEEWVEASLILEKAGRDVKDDPGLTRQIYLLLGRCYAPLGEDDRRLDAYLKARPVDSTDPLWIPAMSGIAETEASLGQSDAALASYRKLADQAAGAWVQVARLELIRVLQTPEDKRDWKAVEQAVGNAEQVLPDATEVELLRADVLHNRGKPAEARKKLEALKVRKPKEIGVWLALAFQDFREGNPVQAAATLDAAQKEAGDSPELRLARLGFWVRAKAPDLTAKIEVLAAGADQFSRPQQYRLLRELAETATYSGANELAGRLWEQLVKLQPHNLKLQLIRFDRAIRAGNEPAIMQVLGEIRRIDGEAGSYSRLSRALVLIWRAQTQKNDAGADEALSLLDGLARERARWARVAFAQALVYDAIKKDADNALLKYEQAVEYGESNPDALRRLMELLSIKGRFGEAEEILRKLPEKSASGPEIQRLAAEVSLRSNNLSRAIEYAARPEFENSKDPKDRIWQGQIYRAAGDRAKSEAAFRKAIELGPDLVDGWLGLVELLADSGRRDEADKLIEAGAPKVKQEDRSLFVALASAILGKTQQARAAFEQARKEKPNDIRVVQAEARYLLESGQPKDAKEAFERVLSLSNASPDDRDFAKRMIGICLAANSDFESSRKALEYLGLVEGGVLRPPSGKETLAEIRSRALVLAFQRDSASKKQAIQLLEQRRQTLVASDLFLLARLYLAVNNKNQVRVVLSELVRKAENVPLYVGFYARWLTRQGSPADLKEATALVKRLEEKLQPEELQTFELKARLLAAKKDLPAARAAIVPRANVKNAPLPTIARICEEISLFSDAEMVWRKFVDENAIERPQARLALAAFLGRRGRAAEALRVCDEARMAGVPMPAVGEVAVLALYGAQSPATADIKRLVGWLEEAIAKSDAAGRAVLVQELASVRNLQADYAASVTLYRQAIEANPKDVLALNNLAYLVSVREGKHDDALKLIEQAKRAIGPQRDLLDTEAMIRLNKNEADAARKILEEIVAESPSGTSYFHLAQAELALDHRLESQVAWRKSSELGLRRADLHPLEWPGYEKMAGMMK
jgi:cellulose synthase operon protein C